MNPCRLVLLALLTVHFVSLRAAEAELTKIPVVKTWGDLLGTKGILVGDVPMPQNVPKREPGAPIPGTVSVRLGIDRAESPLNEAALLYCLVEADKEIPPVGGPDAVGPLTIRIEGMLPRAREIQCLATPQRDPKRKRLYIQAVPFLKPGKHRIIVSYPVEGRAAIDIAEATVEVSETAAPAWVPWGPYARGFAVFGGSIGLAMQNVMSYPVSLPASGAAALPIVPGGEEFPLADSPASTTPLPRLIPTEPSLEVLPIVDAVMVKLPEKITVTPSTYHFLVRWWLNGKEQTKLEAAPALRRQSASRAMKPADIASFMFAPPAGANEGDTVSLQLLFCPREYDFLPSAAPEHLSAVITESAAAEVREIALAAWPTLSNLTPTVDYVVTGGRLVPKAFAADTPAFREIADLFVSDDAVVELRTTRKEYFLGENVLMEFVLKNKGAHSFKYETGGDYRGATRYLRFDVTAKDAAGAPLEDPDPNPMCMGGISTSPELKAGTEWIQSLPITRYRRFDKAGTYTLRASHDFGWVEATRARPVGETTISFVMPDAAQAEKVVEEMKRLPDDPSWSHGEARPAYADFSCLRYPIYLAPLSRLAWSGDKRALQGLGAMETPGATWELIRLMDHPDAALATEAALTLNSRLPDPEWAGKLGARSPFRDGREAQRKRLAAAAWDAKFAPIVRSHAVRLLASGDPQAVSAGGFMLQAVGEPEDLQVVLTELDRQLASFQPRTAPDAHIYGASGSIRELSRAGAMLVARGGQLPEPSTPATDQVWLEALPEVYMEKTGELPAGWEKKILPMLRSPSPLVRAGAAGRLPTSVPKSAHEDLARIFSDPDLGAQYAACNWVAFSKDDTFRPQVLAVLKSTGHNTVFDVASNAAKQIKARRDLLMVLIDRLDDPTQAVRILRELAFLTVERFEGGHAGDNKRPAEEIRKIQEAWKAFAAKYGAEVDDGKKFPVGSPQITPALFGRALRLQLDDGSKWPPEN